MKPVNRGFSLVELSVVVLIIGIIMTMGIGAWTANLENQAHSATAQRQAAIKEALTGYLRRNNRLPCPDNDFTAPDGVENRATPGNPATACSTAFGILPYVTLGLSRDAARDGWGNLFSYQVSNNTNTPDAGGNWSDNRDWTTSANFRAGNTGTITVNDRNGATVTAIASNVVVVVVSHGRNGLGAYAIGGTRNTLPAAGTDERENTDGTANTVYFRREATTDDAATGGPFDDQVAFLTPSDLLDPLFRDGSLKSPQSMVQEQLQKQKQLIIGYTMGYNSTNGGAMCNGGGAPQKCKVVLAADGNSDGQVDAGNANTNGLVPYLTLGMTLADALDPWGMRYRIILNSAATDVSGGISSMHPTSGGGTVAMTVYSKGADRVDGGGDDIALSVTVAEIRTYLVGLAP
jgi:prepilin-type N-terminal cleavage/methylation domain-containing protein